MGRGGGRLRRPAERHVRDCAGGSPAAQARPRSKFAIGIKPLYYARVEKGARLRLRAEGPARIGLGAAQAGPGFAGAVPWEYVPGAGNVNVRRYEPTSFSSSTCNRARRTIRRFWNPLRAAQWCGRGTVRRSGKTRSTLLSPTPFANSSSATCPRRFFCPAASTAHSWSQRWERLRLSASADDRNTTRHNGRSGSHSIWACITASRSSADILRLFERLMLHLDDPLPRLDLPDFPGFQSRAGHVKIRPLWRRRRYGLFGGYETYLAQQAMNVWNKVPAWLRNGVVAPIAAALPPQGRRARSTDQTLRGRREHRPAAQACSLRLFLNEQGRKGLFTGAAYRE